MLYSAAIAVSALSTLAAAQSAGASGYQWNAANITLSPGQLAGVQGGQTQLLAWCRGQQNTCPLLCGGQPAMNTCDAPSQTYNCSCNGGNTPNISDYSQTLPSFICAEWVRDCTADHPNDAAGQGYCQSVICGSKNASQNAVAQSSSSAPASSGASSTGSGAASTGSAAATSAAASSTASTAAAAALNIGAEYGVGAFAMGALAVFGFAL